MDAATARRIKGVLMAQQAQPLQLDAVAPGQQRHGLSAAGLTGPGRIALAQAHSVHRIVGNRQIGQLQIVTEQHRAGATGRAVADALLVGRAGIDRLAGRFGLGVVVASHDDGTRVAVKGQRRLVAQTDLLAVAAGLEPDVVAPPFAGQGVQRGLQAAVRAAAVRSNDEVGRPGPGVKQLWLPALQPVLDTQPRCLGVIKLGSHRTLSLRCSTRHGQQQSSEPPHRSAR